MSNVALGAISHCPLTFTAARNPTNYSTALNTTFRTTGPRNIQVDTGTY